MTVARAGARQAGAPAPTGDIHFLGSGQGSVSAAGILSTLPQLAAETPAPSVPMDQDPGTSGVGCLGW